MSEPYNGWCNYETWCVKLWMDYEEGTYRHWQAMARDAWDTGVDADPLFPSQTASDRACGLLAEQLQDAYEDERPELPASVWADLLGAALAEVEWHEIADALLTTAAENDDAITYEAHS